MSCNLHLIGEQFDTEAFTRKCKLVPYKIKIKGAPVFQTKPKGMKLPHSIVSFQTSGAGFNEFQKQINETILYLRKNSKELGLIKRTKGIEHAILDFGVDLKINNQDIFFQTERLPVKLLKLAAEIGLDIELSIYPLDMDRILENKFGKKTKRKNKPLPNKTISK